MQAARVAKRLHQEFGIEVELVDGPFGRAKVIVNGETIAKTGIGGWLPLTSVIIKGARARLSATD
jgi:hypothetical protein